ncbi:MAG: hypothetical protein ACOY90_13855 [Candidatus Zhuqueibacterota bacterium]
MKKLFSTIILIFLVLMSAHPNRATGGCLVDDVTAELEIFIADASVLFLNDLNLANLEATPLLFSVTVQNNTNAIKSVTLHFGINRGSDVLIAGVSRPFDMQPHEVIYLTNQNIFSGGQRYSLENIDIGSAAEDLKNAILASGKLPAGSYQFYVKVDYQDNTHQNQEAFSDEILNITDPTILDLTSPGQSAEMPDVMELFTPFPFFVWQSNASEFEITVCEKMSTNSSPSDVMTNEPRLRQTIPWTFFQYPSAGAWPLEEGKTYYWQVFATVPSSSGPIRLESEIWGFKIGNVSGGMLSVEHAQMVSLLQTLFPTGGIEGLFEPGGILEGFTFTGVMTVNGQPFTMEDLKAFFQKVLNKEYTIDSYSVE